MTAALIGHTGFVGSNLARDLRFDEFYNSKNIEQIAGRSFDMVVCAGAPGTKWLANADPEKDRGAIDRLIAALRSVRAAWFVLISTVDVYGDPRGVDEGDYPMPATNYGANRLLLESVVMAGRWERVVLRLPSLFGPGMRKGPLYDLMHQHQTAALAPNAVYQWFPVSRLSCEIQRYRGVHNLASEPLGMEQVRSSVFPSVKIGLPVDHPPVYDVRSFWREPYWMTGPDMLNEMRAFVAAERAHA